MDEMLTIHAPLTPERREALHGRFLFCFPASEAELVVLGEGVETQPDRLEAVRADLVRLGASAELIERIDVALRVAVVVRDALRPGFFAGALGAPETGRAQ